MNARVSAVVAALAATAAVAYMIAGPSYVEEPATGTPEPAAAAPAPRADLAAAAPTEPPPPPPPAPSSPPPAAVPPGPAEGVEPPPSGAPPVAVVADDAGATHGLTPEELDARADRCEVRWDLLAFGPEGRAVPTAAAGVAGLTPDERARADAVYARHHELMLAALIAAFTRVYGAAPEAGTSAQAMFEAIEQRSRGPLGNAAFGKLARELAGREPPLPPGTEAPPVEAAFRALTELGPALEADLVKALGAEKARALRSAAGGFGRRFKHVGCGQ